MLRERIKGAITGWKAATLSPGERAPLPGGYGGGMYPDWGNMIAALRNAYQPIDVRDANEGRDNAIVSICLHWIATSWGVATPGIGVFNGSEFVPDKTRHPFLDILESPSAEDDGDWLIWAMNQDYWRRGNGYGHLVHSRRGELIGIDWIPAKFIRPMPNPMGRLAYFEYTPDGTPIALPPDNVIHLKFGLNEDNPLEGVSPLAAQYREIVTDNGYSDFAGGLAQYGAVPPVAFSPRPIRTSEGDKAGMTEDEARTISKKMQELMRKEPGRVRMFPFAAEMHKMGIEPDKMALIETRAMPECRIPAAFGLSPLLLQLYTGAQKSTYNNMGEAIAQGWRGCMIPTQKYFGSRFTRRLRRFYPDMQSMNKELHWDHTQVPELQDDEIEKRKEARADFKEGLLTLEEARAEGGRQTSPLIVAQLEEEREARMPVMGDEDDDEGEDDKDAPPAARKGWSLKKNAASARRRLSFTG